MKFIPTPLSILSALLVFLCTFSKPLNAQQIPSRCFEIESILVDACGPIEGENEMVRFQVGPSSLNSNNLRITWPNNPWRHFCTAPLKIDSFNSTIVSCGYILAPPNGIIPAGKQVIIVTSTDVNVALNSFANLSDTIYMLFQCAGNTAGHFVNYNATPGIRTLIITDTTTLCGDTVSYDRSLLVNINGGHGGGTALENGGSVAYSFNNVATYYDNGCNAPIVVPTVNAGPDSTYHFCTSIPIISLHGTTVGSIKSIHWSGGLGTFSHSDSLNTTYTPSILDIFPIQFILTAQLTCPDSIKDTVNAFIVPPPISIQNKTICAGTSYHIGTHTYTTGGIYVDTLLATGGCDSIITTSLTVITATSQPLNLSGCRSVIYKGVTYTSNTSLLDTLRGSTGCDSINYTVNISIKNPTTHTQLVTICQGQSITIAGHTHTAIGTYVDTLAGANSVGCDSIVTTTLNVVAPTNSTINLSGCTQVIYKGVTYTSSTIEHDTIRTTQGCDSIRNTVNITITGSINTSTNHTICAGQYVTVGVHTYSSAGAYKDTLIASGGCDSIITTHLSVLVASNQSLNLSGCRSVVYKGNTYTSSTSFADTLKGSTGCDSIHYNVNILIKNPTSHSQSLTICLGQSVSIAGHTHTTSGAYTDTLTGANSVGCDSIVTTNLNVVSPTNHTINLSGCSQVVYKGVTYTSSTIEHDTIRTTQGCDSIRNTVNITISNVLRTTLNPSICQGQSFSVGVHSYNANGNYIDTLIALGGCDSVITTTLTVLVPTSQTLNLTACGQLTYKGVTYTANATVPDTIRGSIGCDSVHLTVNITIKSITSYTQSLLVCQGQTITVGAHSHSTQGTFIDTLTNSVGCDSIVTTTLAYAGTPISAGNNVSICQGYSTQLQATGGSTYTWSPSTGLSDSTISNPIASPSGTTTYTLSALVPIGNQITNADFSQGNTGFSSGYTYTNVAPGAPCGAYGILGCEGYYNVNTNAANTHSQFVSFGDHTTGTGQMMIVNGATSPSINVWCQTINVLPNTNYQFSAWVANVDNAPSSLPNLQFTINGNVLGNPFSPSITGGIWSQFAVTWFSGSNTSINICLTDSSIATGGNDFALDDIAFSSVCNASTTVQVTVKSSSYHVQSPVICPGQTISVGQHSYGSTGTYQDTISGAASSGCDSIVTTHLTVVTPTTGTKTVSGVCSVVYKGTTYSSSTSLQDTLKSSATGCDSIYYAVTITVTPPTPATITKNVCINTGQSYLAGGHLQTTSGLYTDTLLSSKGCDSTITLTDLNVITPIRLYQHIDSCSRATVNGNLYTSNTIINDTVHSSLGCDSIITTDSIIIYQPVNISISSSQTLPLVEGDSTLLTITPAGTYQNIVWAPDTNISNINTPSTQVWPQRDTTYHVAATDSNNCQVAGSIEVTVKPNGKPDFVMPDAFSPNGDGRNDLFKPILRSTSVQVLSFHIYNRWGQKVYDLDKSSVLGWDGLYKGDSQPTDTYTYYITVMGIAGNVVKQEGSFMLFR